MPFEGALNLSHNSIFNEQGVLPPEIFFGYRRLPWVTNGYRRLPEPGPHPASAGKICRGILSTGFPL